MMVSIHRIMFFQKEKKKKKKDQLYNSREK